MNLKIKQFLFIIFMGICFFIASVNAQQIPLLNLWLPNDDETGIYPRDLSLNVGIGTSTPSYNLTVASTTATYDLIVNNEAWINLLHASTTDFDDLFFINATGTNSLNVENNIRVGGATTTSGILNIKARSITDNDFITFNDSDGKQIGYISEAGSVGNAGFEMRGIRDGGNGVAFVQRGLVVNDDGTEKAAVIAVGAQADDISGTMSEIANTPLFMVSGPTKDYFWVTPTSTKMDIDLRVNANATTTGSFYAGDMSSGNNVSAANSLRGSYLESLFVGAVDLRGDPWYLSGTSLEIADNLDVDGNLNVDGNATTSGSFQQGSALEGWKMENVYWPLVGANLATLKANSFGGFYDIGAVQTGLYVLQNSASASFPNPTIALIADDGTFMDAVTMTYDPSSGGFQIIGMVDAGISATTSVWRNVNVSTLSNSEVYSALTLKAGSLIGNSVAGSGSRFLFQSKKYTGIISGVFTDAAAIQSTVTDNDNGTDFSNDLRFYTTYNSSGLTERLRITDDGKLGVNTTTPKFQSVVGGKFYAYDDIMTNGQILAGITDDSAIPAGTSIYSVSPSVNNIIIKSTALSAGILIDGASGRDSQLFFTEDNNYRHAIFSDQGTANDPLIFWDYTKGDAAMTINNGDMLFGHNATTTGSHYIGGDLTVAGSTELVDVVISNYQITGNATTSGYLSVGTDDGNFDYDAGDLNLSGTLYCANDFSANYNSRIGDSSSYLQFEKLDLSGFGLGDYPMLVAYSGGFFGNVGAIADSLIVYDKAGDGNMSIAFSDQALNIGFIYYDSGQSYPFNFDDAVDFDSDVLMNSGLQIDGELSVNKAAGGSYNVDVLGTIHASDVIYGGSYVQVGYDSADDDDYLLFDAGNESLMWHNTNEYFSFSDDLNIEAEKYYKYNGSNIAYASTTLSNYFFGGSGNDTMSGDNNSAVGFWALHSNTTGYKNTANGVRSLRDNTEGYQNTAVGYIALMQNTVGQSNIAFGANALDESINGSGNNALGANSLTSNLTGSGNTANGNGSLRELLSTNYNSGIGYRAGTGDDSDQDYHSTIDSNMVFVGAFSSRDSNFASTTALTKGAAIGYNAKVGCSNCMALGGTGVDALRVGIATSTPWADFELAVAGDGIFTGNLVINSGFYGDPFSDYMTYSSIGKMLDYLTSPKLAVNWFTPSDAGTEIDYSSQSNDLTYADASNWTATDQIHKGFVWALDFDGTDDYLYRADDDDFSFGNGTTDSDFTISGWVQVVPFTVAQYIADKWNGDTAQREWLFRINTDETLGFYAKDESAGKVPQRITASALSSGWHFIAVVYNSSAGSGATFATGLTLYVDGVATAGDTVTNEALYVAMENSTSEILVGALNGTTVGNYWKGDMGALIVEKSALSSYTIWKMYMNTRGDYNI